MGGNTWKIIEIGTYETFVDADKIFENYIQINFKVEFFKNIILYNKIME